LRPSFRILAYRSASRLIDCTAEVYHFSMGLRRFLLTGQGAGRFSGAPKSLARGLKPDIVGG
jgi:hypothetical protein